MHDNQALLERHYAAFGDRDHQTMAETYAADARFSDPVFPELVGDRIAAMWRMLCLRATDLVIEASDVHADDDQGRAHWEARYTFGATGRRVHNRIDATFRFRGGRVVEHVDRFDLWAWSRQALGVSGVLLGWSPIVRNEVRGQAARQLDRFIRDEKG